MRAPLLVSLFLVATSAHAVVIDFDSQLSSSNVNAPSYSEDGYTFTSTATASNAFTFWGTTADYGYAGSPALFHNYNFETATLAAADGSAFSLLSIDIAEIFNISPSSYNAVLNAIRSDGTATSTTLAIDGIFGMQTFLLGATLSNVISVSWTNIYGAGQFDNLVIEPATVPEPSTFALFGIALAGMVATKRKRK